MGELVIALLAFGLGAIIGAASQAHHDAKRIKEARNG